MNGKDLLPQGTESERTIMFNFENESERKEEAATPAEADVDTEIQDNQENTDPLPSSVEGAVAVRHKGKRVSAEILDYLEIFVLAISFVIILFSFVFRICTVRGDSMMNTLYENESLVVSNLFYEPKAEDVIVFHQTGTLDEPVVKRVIAVAGEKVDIRYTYDTMTVTITDKNGVQRVLEEDYMRYEGMPLYLAPYTATVPEGCIFVLGDNRNDSMDSRNPGIGMVDERRVLGKVILRLTPISRFGSVS